MPNKIWLVLFGLRYSSLYANISEETVRGRGERRRVPPPLPPLKLVLLIEIKQEE
jgi:hypothetical protein